MPVFDFNNAPEEKKEVVCTYTTFSSNEKTTSAEKPILVLDNKKNSGNITQAVSSLILQKLQLLSLKRKTEQLQQIF